MSNKYLMFYYDLKNIPGIRCNLELLESRFNIGVNQYFHKVFDHENHIWLSEKFEDWLKSLGLHIQRLEIFHTEANRITGWHIDMNPPKDWIKINWIFEKGYSYMEWADLNIKEPLISLPSIAGTSYVRFEEESTKMVCRYNLKGPTLINVGRPHRINNSKSTDRWCLSTIPWYTDKQCRVLWQDAIQIFKDYLK
jgi:hypothetical protein